MGNIISALWPRYTNLVAILYTWMHAKTSLETLALSFCTFVTDQLLRDKTVAMNVPRFIASMTTPPKFVGVKINDDA